MKKSVKIVMALLVNYVLLFVLVKATNPQNLSFSQLIRHDFSIFFSPDPHVVVVTIMSFIGIILFNISIFKSNK